MVLAQVSLAHRKASQPQLFLCGSCCIIASSSLSSFLCRTTAMKSWILFHAPPDFVVWFPEEAQLVLSYHVPMPLCAYPSVLILVTAEHVGQRLPNLQGGTNL